MYKRILVPLDGSDVARKALATAIGLAKTFGARVRLLHVVEEMAYLTGFEQFGGYSDQLARIVHDNADRILGEGMATAREAGVEVDNMLIEELGGRLGENVANAAKLWGADLVVTGTHGRKGLGRALLGSGAEQIIRLSPVPVLAVRGDEPAAA